MIGRIRGLLVERQPPRLMVECAGVGYELEAPMSVFYNLPEAGVEVSLYTHFVVREDAQLLYAFSSCEERELFRTLIKVNGVGPKMGLALLSGMDVRAFARCVHENDVATLVKLPGVGKKTAERLLIEMQGKLDHWQSTPLLDGVPVIAGGETAQQSRELKGEAVEALIALGYKAAAAEKVVKGVFQEDMSSEALIRLALKSMI